MKSVLFLLVACLGLNASAGALRKSLEGKTCTGLASNSGLSFEIARKDKDSKRTLVVTLGRQLTSDTYEYFFNFDNSAGILQVLEAKEGRNSLLKLSADGETATYFQCDILK